MMRTFTIAATVVANLALADHYFDGKGELRLRMNRDNHFKVMQLTDLHFGETHHAKLDAETLDMIVKMIEKEQPDFVAVTGDIVSGQSWDHTSDRFWERHWRKLADTLTA